MVEDAFVVRTQIIGRRKHITMQIVATVPCLRALKAATADTWIASGQVSHRIADMDDDHVKAVYQYLLNKASHALQYSGIPSELWDQFVGDVLNSHPSWRGICAEYDGRNLVSQREHDRELWRKQRREVKELKR